jgi:membrane-bound lytic murein transglycosylase B
MKCKNLAELSRLGVSSVVTALFVASCAPKPAPLPPVVAAPVLPQVVSIAPASVPPVTLPQTEPATVSPATSQSFDAWRLALRAEAIGLSIRPEVFDAAFDRLTPNPRVIELDRGQPEVKTTSAQYIGRRLTSARIAQGQRVRIDNSVVLTGAEQIYGVPSSVMVAIWGMETSYGSDMGRMGVIRSLASLAYDGRRSALFRRELLAALTILNDGKARPEQMQGSWAGAMGHPQFMPSSYLELGVDGNGDGKVDIWSSLDDVFASMGNYLKSRGWQSGVPWGVEVRLPETYDAGRYVELTPATGCKRAMEKHSALRPVASWKADGLAVAVPETAFPADTVMASVVRPDGVDGPAFLVTENYRVILAYNCSNYYALSVLLLSDKVG